MADTREIISRCTRNGVTSWQHVAMQLGCSIDAVRRGYDPNYLSIRPWPTPAVEVPTPPEQEDIDENDAHSLASKGPGMAIEILSLLNRLGPMTVESLSNWLDRPKSSVRKRLCRMKERHWTDNDSAGRSNGASEWTWHILPKGRVILASGTAESIRDRVTGRAEAERSAA